MSGHWRFFVTACLLVAGPSTLPAFSNPLTDLLSPAPKEAETLAPAPAPVREACLSHPGSSAARGQHWFYHLDGHRKCWFQAAEKTASAKTLIHRYAARRPGIEPDEDEVAPRKKTPLDARAQLLSVPQADALQPTAPAPQAAEKVSEPDDGAATTSVAATIVPAAPIAAQPAIDQTMPNRTAPRSVDVETLLAASVLDKDAAASSVPSGTSIAPSIPATAEDHWESTATRAGMGLIALGFLFLVGSLLVSRFFGRGVVPLSRAW